MDDATRVVKRFGGGGSEVVAGCCQPEVTITDIGGGVSLCMVAVGGWFFVTAVREVWGDKMVDP